MNQLSSISAWRSDAYMAMSKRFLESVSIQEYNDNLLFKENFFEDKEWFTDMTDGEELMQALIEQEKAQKAAAEALKKGGKRK